jgi:hypothetical protein
VKGRLSVEQDDITVFNVTFDDITNLEGACKLGTVTESKVTLSRFVLLGNIVGTRVDIWTVVDELLKFVLVVTRASLWVGQHFGNTVRNSHLIDLKVGVRGDDGTPGEVDSLTG